jgi:hypothetical protein
MPTPTFYTGFEHKLVEAVPGTGVPVTAQLWDSVTGTPIVETSIVHHGSAAIRFTGVATQHNVLLNHAAGIRRLVVSVYIYLVTLPTVTGVRFITVQPNANAYGIGVDTSGNWFATANGGSNQTGAAAVAGRWTRIDFDADATAGNGTTRWRIDGVAQTNATGVAALVDIQQLAVGLSSATSTVDFIVDCLTVSQTGADYPLGEYVVKGYRPNNDDDITQVGAGAFVDAAVGAISGGNPAWDNLLDMTNASATRVEQTAIAGTGYINVGFDNEVGRFAPLSVMAIASMRADSTAATDGQVQVDDGGTLDTFTGLFDPSEATNVVMWKVLNTPPSGGSWTLAKLNALAMRFGYSTDANPDTWFVGLMFEALFPPEPVQRVEFEPIPFIPKGRSF